MNINIINLTRLIGGELLNNPSISAIDDFAFDAKSVRNCYAFFAFDENEINEAIKNGAYAIITDKNIEILNNEIAYIKVQSLEFALEQLIKFLLNSKKVNFIKLDYIQSQIIKCLHFDKNIFFLDRNLKDFFKFLNKTSFDEISIFAFDDSEILKFSKIYDAVNTFKVKSLKNNSLFISSFVLDDIYYQNLFFPNVFLDEFCGILKFLKSKKIEFKISDFKNFDHFEPIFIDDFFNIAPFLSSQRAIIVENDQKLFLTTQEKLKKDMKNIVSVSFFSQNLKSDIKINSLKELKNIKDFHYLLLCDEKENVLNFLNSDCKKEEKSIFDFV